MRSHTISQPKPRSPVRMNAQYQPNRTVMNGTVIGVITAPMLVPALNTPVANARSLRGNHSATVLIAAGKFPDSPSPSMKRTKMNPATDEEYARPRAPRNIDAAGPNRVTSAAAIAASDHTTSASAKPLLMPMRSMIDPANRNPIAYASWNAKTMSA